MSEHAAEYYLDLLADFISQAINKAEDEGDREFQELGARALQAVAELRGLKQ